MTGVVEPLDCDELVAVYALLVADLDAVVAHGELPFAAKVLSASVKVGRALVAVRGGWPMLEDELASQVARLDQVRAAVAESSL